ncbi:hypothetical protein B0H67DRAFT_222358 [Lasiosphaeris hirsuta]|uniref:Uncharacterized protein n=1 Tax=Lasiosphaeris hirsuta TaxID=260670 RepID=A0AA40DWY7_9PEZI|nr:hypothetical protein B0H67DRAFT_222358 [Lasiosphaeris hirsuta]
MLSSARILTYGYDAYVVRKSAASSNRLIDHAANLLNDLAGDRMLNKALSRPLIFSSPTVWADLYVNKLFYSHETTQSITSATCSSALEALFWLGTPHRGAWMADWARIPVSALGLVWKSTNKSLLKVLEADN